MIYHLDHNKKCSFFLSTNLPYGYIITERKKEDLFTCQCMMFRLILYQQSGGSGFFAVNVIDMSTTLEVSKFS